MKEKRKILHVVGKMNPGGIETLLMNIYRNIDRDRFDFHFAVQSNEPAFYDDEIRTLGGTIIVQPPPKDGLATFKRKFIENIRKYGPYDVVHSHVFGFSGYILKLAHKLGIPIRISHSHNTHDSRKSSLLRRVYRMYMCLLIKKHATHMLGCSRDACVSLFGTRCFEDPRVTIFPNAIQLEPFAKLPVDRSKLKQRLGFAKDEILIGHIGRFHQQKNHTFLLNIFSSFAKIRPTSKLLLVGDGPLRKSIELQAIDLGIADNVLFLGLRKDIPEILGALDAFVLPSLYEGLGIVLIEAQAAGVPCLISDVVPYEADLGLGMISRLSTRDTSQRWSDMLEELIHRRKEIPDWEQRSIALAQHGYDIRVSTSKLERLYEN
jgi:glycosyltransferase involved in cell wall biosynthesis